MAEIERCLSILNLIQDDRSEAKMAKTECERDLQEAKNKMQAYFEKHKIETSAAKPVAIENPDWEDLEKALDKLEDCYQAPYGEYYPEQFRVLVYDISDLAGDCQEEIRDDLYY